MRELELAPRLKSFFTGPSMPSYIDRWFVYFFLSTEGCSAVMWNTAVNVNSWLVVTVCNEARGGEEDGERSGEGWSKREGKGADPQYSHSPTKRTLHLAKTPRGVKSITDARKERQLNPSRPWVLVLFCRELRSHPYYMQELVWSLYCSSLHGQLGFAVQGPSGSPVSPTHKHTDTRTAPVMQIHQLPWLSLFILSLSATSSGF